MARRTGWQASRWPRPGSRPPAAAEPQPRDERLVTLTAQVAAGTELAAYIDAVMAAVANNGLTAIHALDLIATKRTAYEHACTRAWKTNR